MLNYFYSIILKIIYFISIIIHYIIIYLYKNKYYKSRIFKNVTKKHYKRALQKAEKKKH
jgi:hypothetical protein